jgi:hypothetical protein
MRARFLSLFFGLLLGAAAQLPPVHQPPPHNVNEPPNERLPNGKLQRDEILKDDYQKSLQDASELVKLSDELKADLEKDTQYVMSLGAIKKTEEIEKLAKRIRSRMKRI